MTTPAVAWTLLPERRRVVLEHADGTVVSHPMSASMWPAGSHSRWVRHDLAAHELTVGLPLGDEPAVVELRAARDPAALVAGRALVYLDTNAWSWLSDVRFGRALKSPSATAAARRLLELGDANRVIYPFSAGSLVELARRHEVPRVEHACTVMALSRGWRMRHPVRVRGDELAGAMAGDGHARPAVFAPTAEDFSMDGVRPSAPPDFPEPHATHYVESLEAMATLEAVIEPEAIDADLRAAAAWAAGLEGLSRQLHRDGVAGARLRRVAGARVIADLADEVQAAAMRADLSWEQATELLLGPDDPIAAMPYLARQRGMITGRLLDPAQKWEANDLLDINNLSCAAGHADVVVCERNAAHHLRASRPVPAGARITRSLQEAVVAVEHVLAERSA